MIQFEEALDIISSAATLLDTENIRLEDSLDRILAADVFSDMDIPPFDKSAVDGYACRRQDLMLELKALEVIAAGKIPSKIISQGECSKIMTGGMLPQGADTVIMIEDVVVTGTHTIRFTGTGTAPNFCLRAEDLREGEKVLSQGTLIRPQEIAVLASAGIAFPLVYRKPRIGIIATGDELVEPDQKPSLSQIRNSNAWQLLAQAKRSGCLAQYFGIAGDNEEITLQLIEQAVNQSDIVVLTGGISVGDFDFVPEVIQQAGFELKFRSLAVQPGKPVIFATKKGKYLVALPGNPVSSFVQFEMLVRHLIRLITGNSSELPSVKLPMGMDYIRKRSTRKTFFPVSLTPEGTTLPVDYHGSAHIHAYIHAQGIVTIQIGEQEIKKGTLVDVRLV